MPFPGLITHDRDTDIHSLVASVQKLLYPGCYLLFCFFPHFVLLMAVKSKFKGDSHFPKLRFFFLAGFFSLLRSVFHFELGENSGSRALQLKTECLLTTLPPQGWPACMIPFSPLQLLNSYQGVVWASSGPRWRSVGGVHGAGGEKLGYIVWVGHGNRRSQRNRTSFVLLCKWPGFSHYLSTSARHQTIWSPGKLKLGSPLLPFFDHILSQEWTWGGSPEHGEMCTQQKHNDHRGRTGSVFSSVPQIQRSPFPEPCQHFLLKGWAPPKSLCQSPAGPAGGSSPRESQGSPQHVYS